MESEELQIELIKHIGDNMPCISYIDEDYGQLEMIDQETPETYPLTYPCVLVDGGNVDWSNTGNSGQLGLITVKTRLILDCYDDTHYRSGMLEAVKRRAELAKTLHKLVKGFHPDKSLSDFIRINSRTYTYSHGIKVYETAYTTEIKESDAELPKVASDSVRIKLSVRKI